MKKSQGNEQEPARKKPNFLLSLLFSEGGFSTLIILPVVIYYFFTLAL